MRAPIPVRVKDSVALLVVARALVAQHDDDEVVSRLCCTFGIGADDANGAVVAARLLASQPQWNNQDRETEAPHLQSVTASRSCTATPSG